MANKKLTPITGQQGKTLTNKQREALRFKKAHGEVVLLAIGISDYNKSSDFAPLKTCSNDAIAVRDAFLDVWQLNVDSERITTLTSESEVMPSRGFIIHHVKNVSDSCNSEDRLVIYFSGHGQRLKDASGEDKFYLVPQDAYDESNPDALVSFDNVLELIESSEAKQKIIIIDACMSGPSVEGKKLLPATYSKKFLAEYMEKTKGIIVIASSSETQSSFTQSPNPKLSLFTFFLVNGLRGDPRALDGTILTTDSLFAFLSTEVTKTAKSYQRDQTPVISCTTSGVPILADFSQSIIPPGNFDLDGSPVTEISFLDFKSFKVKEVLTNIKNWSYSQDYLESITNKKLGEHLEDDLGEKASSLRKTIRLSPSEVGVNGTTISFPAGEYRIEYSAEDKQSGKLVITLTLDSDWFGHPNDIPKIVGALNMSPTEMMVEFSKEVDPVSFVPGLEAKKWETTSLLTGKIEATIATNYHIRIDTHSITFWGFLPSELFGDKTNKDKAMLASSVLALLIGR